MCDTGSYRLNNEDIEDALNVDTPSDSSLLKARNLIIRVMHRTPFVRCIDALKDRRWIVDPPYYYTPQRTPFSSRFS